MATYGFVYDQSRCIGCNTCQMACKDGHDLEPGLFLRRAATLEFTDYEGKLHTIHYSGSCNHCNTPACLNRCPSGAIHRQADGTIAVDPQKCIGCGTCTWVCPYGAPKLSHKTGRSMKCDACYDRRQAGKEPLCVESCLTHCLRFTDLDTLVPEERARYTNRLPYLPDPTETDPNVRILPKEADHG